jgi:hypothetical protein
MERAKEIERNRITSWYQSCPIGSGRFTGTHIDLSVSPSLYVESLSEKCHLFWHSRSLWSCPSSWSTYPLPQIIWYCLSAGQTADLALGTQFVNARCRAHQMVCLMEFSSTELHLNLFIRSVARLFNIAHYVQARASIWLWRFASARTTSRTFTRRRAHAGEVDRQEGT